MTFGQLRLAISILHPAVDPDSLDLFINLRLQKITSGFRWKALEADGAFLTLPTYTTGTLSLTGGSTAVTGVGTTFTAGMSGMRLLVTSFYESYTFTYLSPTSGTLDRPYEQATATSYAFTLYQNLYPLPADYDQPRDAVNTRVNGEIEYWDRSRLDQAAPSRLIFGEPRLWTEATPLSDAAYNFTHVAELFPIPEFAAEYPFRYLRSLASYGDLDTAKQIPSWISIPALMAGCRSDCSAKGSAAQLGYEKEFDVEVGKMRIEDANRRGPQHIRMAERYVRHRLQRVMSSGRVRLP